MLTALSNLAQDFYKSGVHLLPIVLVQHQHQVALANLILAPVYIYAIMLGEVDSSMWEQVLIDCDRGFYARLGLPSPRASLLGSRNGSATSLARISGAFRSRSLSSASLALGRAHAHSLIQGIGGALRSSIELVLGRMSQPSSPPATGTVRLGDASDVNGTYYLADGEEDWDSFYVNLFPDRDMFIRFRGSGVGHLGTRYLDSRLKVDNHESADEQQDDEENNSYPHEEWGNGAEEESGTRHEEYTGRKEPSNEEDVEDEVEVEVEDTDSGNEHEDEQDLDDEDMDDDEIHDKEGFAEL
ncbi:hypothetical protein F5888DRAFT_1803385 [Russula emetica]|nr:hypothetical protein F5888DRAFT_1803385 [Russula emetica]